MKLDRFLSRQDSIGRTGAHRLIAARRVRVNGEVITDGHFSVDRFCAIELDGRTIQAGSQALYIVLHKPPGYVSATVDPEFPTVLDLVDHPERGELHLAGRLDRFTSGMVLLTNDGRWSKRITESTPKVPKIYLVDTDAPVKDEDVVAFAAGFHFHTEDITTQPAVLEILGERRARLTLVEGRYHQVKRMFHRVGNRVVCLHRAQIGGLPLPEDLQPGQWRVLTPDEVRAVTDL